MSKSSTDAWWSRREIKLTNFIYFYTNIKKKILAHQSHLFLADSGHFVHRPIRAAGGGERRLSCGLLYAASLSLPGASLCQNLKKSMKVLRSEVTVINLTRVLTSVVGHQKGERCSKDGTFCHVLYVFL